MTPAGWKTKTTSGEGCRFVFSGAGAQLSVRGTRSGGYELRLSHAAHIERIQQRRPLFRVQEASAQRIASALARDDFERFHSLMLSRFYFRDRRHPVGRLRLKQLVSAKKTDTSAAVVPPLDQAYAYDPMGNGRTYTEQGKSVAYAANAANQYTGISESISAGAPVQSALVYDANGNLRFDGAKNYSWDAENQLIAVTPVTATEGSQRVEYTYDWRMRRTGKKSYTYTAGAWNLTKTTGFKYHEWNPIQEVITLSPSTSSHVTSAKQYIWGNDLSGNLHGAGGVGGLLSMQYAGDTYFHAYDGNGNVRALVQVNAAKSDV